MELESERLYQRCPQCGHEIRLTQSLPEPMLNEILGEHVRKPDIKDRFQVKLSLKATPKRDLLIDVGSGSGRFLFHAHKVFRQVLGVEPSKQARDFAQSILQIPTTAELPLERIRDASLITFWHSLEHIPKEGIEQILQEIAAHLPKDSPLIFSVPNNAGLHARIFGSRSVFFDRENHLHQFSYKSLTDLLKKYQFRTASVHTSFAYSFLGNLLSFVNLFFKEHNVVYLTLRRANASQYSRARLLTKAAILAILCAPLAVLLYAFEVVFPQHGAVATLVALRQSPAN